MSSGHHDSRASPSALFSSSHASSYMSTPESSYFSFHSCAGPAVDDASQDCDAGPGDCDSFASPSTIAPPGSAVTRPSPQYAYVPTPYTDDALPHGEFPVAGDWPPMAQASTPMAVSYGSVTMSPKTVLTSSNSFFSVAPTPWPSAQPSPYASMLPIAPDSATTGYPVVFPLSMDGRRAPTTTVSAVNVNEPATGRTDEKKPKKRGRPCKYPEPTDDLLDQAKARRTNQSAAVLAAAADFSLGLPTPTLPPKARKQSCSSTASTVSSTSTNPALTLSLRPEPSTSTVSWHRIGKSSARPSLSLSPTRPSSYTPASDQHSSDLDTSKPPLGYPAPARAATVAAQRVRNRAAASRCRKKLAAVAADLEEREQQQHALNTELTTEAAELRDEVLRLKNVLLAHGLCDCPLMRRYLFNAAAGIVVSRGGSVEG